MPKLVYIGDCAKGEVVFREGDNPPTVMPRGEEVEVSQSLYKKLEANKSHFLPPDAYARVQAEEAKAKAAARAKPKADDKG